MKTKTKQKPKAPKKNEKLSLHGQNPKKMIKAFMSVRLSK